MLWQAFFIMLKIVNFLSEWHVIYWFRADLLKGKDRDLNFITYYSSQLPQICPLFDFHELSFHGFIYCLICLYSSVIPFPLGSSVVPFPQLTNIQLHWGIEPKFVFLVFVHCLISPSSLGWLIVLLLAQVHQLSIFLQAVGSTNSYPFFQVSRKI